MSLRRCRRSPRLRVVSVPRICSRLFRYWSFVTAIALVGCAAPGPVTPRPASSPRPSFGEESPLASGPAPELGGSTLIAYSCFTADEPIGSICTVRVDGTGMTRLPQSEAFDRVFAKWSPDGTRFVVRQERPNGPKLMVMNADGSGEHLITDATREQGDMQAAWSPDGTTIAVGSARPGEAPHPGIYLMAPDGSGVKRLSGRDVWAESPSWSPDGKRLVVTVNTTGRSSADYDVWVMNADGTRLSPLATMPGTDEAPAFSPDGKSIVFERERVPGRCEEGECEFDIWMMNADGSNAHPILASTTPELYEWPVWSPDGTQILFKAQTGDTTSIEVMNPDGSGRRRLFVNGDNATWRPY